MNKRTQLVTIAGLSVALALSLWANVRCRYQLHEAERYLKSSFVSWATVCTQIAGMYAMGTATPELGAHCVPLDEWAVLFNPGFGRTVPASVIEKALVRRLEENQLPRVFDDEQMENYRFPRGYAH